MEESRYLVSWVPLRAVEAACRKRGMKAGDGTSFWDWIEPEECAQTLEKRSFFEAVYAARAVLPFDVCGEVRISREVLIRNHDDLGNVLPGRSWEEEAVWHLHDADDDMQESEPDYRCAA